MFRDRLHRKKFFLTSTYNRQYIVGNTEIQINNSSAIQFLPLFFFFGHEAHSYKLQYWKPVNYTVLCLAFAYQFTCYSKIFLTLWECAWQQCQARITNLYNHDLQNHYLFHRFFLKNIVDTKLKAFGRKLNT